VFFASMLVFDMATTALNNFIDTRSNGQPLPFARRTALLILVTCLSWRPRWVWYWHSRPT
jgi:hypothetical protein